MVGVLPLFIAFASFGMVVFGPYNYRFGSWQRTFVEMFAVRASLCDCQFRCSCFAAILLGD